MRERVLTIVAGLTLMSAVAFVRAEVTVHEPARSPTAPPEPRPSPTATRVPEKPGQVTPGTTATPPPIITGYVGTLAIDASLPALRDGASGPPEAQALLGRLRDKAQLKTTVYLTKNLSRLEVLNSDFFLPAGTLILHEAGSRFHVIADPKEKTYVVMDVEGILSALEGGIGIANSQYQAKAEHTAEKKAIDGFTCRKSRLTVTYASSIPFENSTVLVQQTNDIEVWHTPDLVSAALVDHFFFKFERDRTHVVKKVVDQELGFPMEMTMAIATGGARKAPGGTLSVKLSGLHEDKKLASELFRLPPAGYKKVERSPYFSGARTP